MTASRVVAVVILGKPTGLGHGHRVPKYSPVREQGAAGHRRGVKGSKTGDCIARCHGKKCRVQYIHPEGRETSLHTSLGSISLGADSNSEIQVLVLKTQPAFWLSASLRTHFFDWALRRERYTTGMALGQFVVALGCFRAWGCRF